MLLNWTKPVLLSALLLGGCATNPDKLLPHGDVAMLDIWTQQTIGSGDVASRRLLDARQTLRRPLQSPVPTLDQSGYTRTAKNEIYRQFQRLPNPDLVMWLRQAEDLPGFRSEAGPQQGPEQGSLLPARRSYKGSASSQQTPQKHREEAPRNALRPQRTPPPRHFRSLKHAGP